MSSRPRRWGQRSQQGRVDQQDLRLSRSAGGGGGACGACGAAAEFNLAHGGDGGAEALVLAAEANDGGGHGGDDFVIVLVLAHEGAVRLGGGGLGWGGWVGECTRLSLRMTLTAFDTAFAWLKTSCTTAESAALMAEPSGVRVPLLVAMAASGTLRVPSTR
jgi:hypothetical protein